VDGIRNVIRAAGVLRLDAGALAGELHLGRVGDVVVRVADPAGVRGVDAVPDAAVLPRVPQPEPVTDLVHGRLALVHVRVPAAGQREGRHDAAVERQPPRLVRDVAQRLPRVRAGAAVAVVGDVANVEVDGLVVAPVQGRLHVVEVKVLAGPAAVDDPLLHALGVVEGDTGGLVQILDELYLAGDFGFLTTELEYR
jgi:hypothetical protein